MLRAAWHRKPAATKWETTRDQFQYICIILPKFHVLQSFACSPVRVHGKFTGLVLEMPAAWKSGHRIRAASKRRHRTNKNYLKWSFARKDWRPPTEITRQLPATSHGCKLERNWDKSLKLTPLKPQGVKPQKGQFIIL